jgi:hypothetical protein
MEWENMEWENARLGSWDRERLSKWGIGDVSG